VLMCWPATSRCPVFLVTMPIDAWAKDSVGFSLQHGLSEPNPWARRLITINVGHDVAYAVRPIKAET
jgi:hypothetical protein